MASDEEILIKLKRHYSKDEYVAALLKLISKKNIELGQYKSLDEEILAIQKKNQELEIQITALKKQLKDANKSIKESKLYKDLLTSNKKKREEIKKLRIFRDQLLSQLNSKQ